MDAPLLSAQEAHKRAVELLAQFAQSPDVLSPDEQVLAMEINSMRVALRVCGLLAMEWGFRASERGLNFEASRTQFRAVSSYAD